MFNLNLPPAGRDVARQAGGRFPIGEPIMREQEPVRPDWKWVVVGDGDDDDFSAWPDSSGDDGQLDDDFSAWPDSSGDDGGLDEDELAIARAMAAFARGEDEWWASAFD